MKKLLCCGLGLGMALALGHASFSQTETAPSHSKTAGLELHGTWAFQWKNKIEGEDNPAGDIEDTFWGGASLVFCLADYVRLDLGADYLKARLKEDKDFFASVVPVAGTLRFGYPAYPFWPYIGGGAGYSINDIDWNKAGVVVPEIDDCFTYHACGGFELNLIENIALRLEFRYVWMEPKTYVEGFEDLKTKWTLDHMEGRAGLSFLF